MKLFRPIDSVFWISAVIFGSSCIVLKFAGGIGPCGPSSAPGFFAMLGAPIGCLGMVVGFIVSLAVGPRKQKGDGPDDEQR
jgi:hypothetical protein